MVIFGVTVSVVVRAGRVQFRNEARLHWSETLEGAGRLVGSVSWNRPSRFSRVGQA